MAIALEEGDPIATVFNAAMTLADAEGWIHADKPIQKPIGLYFRLSPPMEFHDILMVILGANEEKMFAVGIGMEGNTVGYYCDNSEHIGTQIDLIISELREGKDNSPIDLIEIMGTIEEAKR